MDLISCLCSMAIFSICQRSEEIQTNALNRTIFTATRLEENRNSSDPYVTGDTFRAHADFVYDETHIPFSPDKVFPGSTVFVKGDYLGRFFSQVHPLIQAPYVLIAHNSDNGVPGRYAHFLKEEKLIAWFGQNVEQSGLLKLHPIPIGIANRYWEHGDISVFDAMKVEKARIPKTSLLYLNFSVNPEYRECTVQERTRVYQQFSKEPYCQVATPKDLRSYLSDLAASKFVLSPLGNGLDCHRTWEALYMGAIPIVRTSTLDPLFEGLPVLIVQDWSEITQSYLEEKYREMQNRTYRLEKLYSPYWLEQIDAYKVK